MIKHMVNRFLGWRLPEDFYPDDGISFKATFNEHTDHPMRHEPTGTNLFSATQAEVMVRYILEGTPLVNERMGTHSEDCWKWGRQHYECALRHIEDCEDAALATAIRASEYE